MIRLTSHYFCAGLILSNGYVSAAAPILHYMKGRSEMWVLEYATRKGWTYERLD